MPSQDEVQLVEELVRQEDLSNGAEKAAAGAPGPKKGLSHRWQVVWMMALAFVLCNMDKVSLLLHAGCTVQQLPGPSLGLHRTKEPHLKPAPLLQVNMSVAVIPMAKELGWSNAQRGIASSAFFGGYTATQIPAGIISTR